MKAPHPTLGNCSLRCLTTRNVGKGLPTYMREEKGNQELPLTLPFTNWIPIFTGMTNRQGMSSTFLSSLTRTMRSFLLTPSINAVALAI